MNTNSSLSDQKLYQLCITYGEQAKKWRYKFMGLLPEVNRRRLYEKKGFQSIFEFAKKLAGVSEEQVRRVLNLEKKFEETPALKNLLVSGEVSVNKLARVASIATKENEEILANQAEILSKSALETLVKDEKKSQTETALPQGQIGLFETKFEAKSVPGHNSEEQLQLSPKIKERLLELQRKGINLDQLLEEFLDQREEEIKQEKEELVEELRVKAATQTPRLAQIPRYIPVKIRNLIKKEHGNKCSIPTCQKPAETIHHTQRFALAGIHDPRYLAPLCKNHHQIAHSIDVKFQEKRLAAFG